MRRAWSILITGDMENCDAMGRDHCDDRGHVAF